MIKSDTANKIITRRKIFLYLLIIAVMLAYSTVHAQTPIVRGVLFYSPTCSFCHTVMTEVIPPMLDKYGDQLQIAAIDTSKPDGQNIYLAVIQKYQLPDERLGVPMLIVGNTIMVGAREIPDQLPILIEKHLADGGIDWPDIPGLQEVLAAQQTTGSEGSSSPTGLIMTDLNPPTIQELIARDPAGNALAIVVLVGMIVSLVWMYFLMQPGRRTRSKKVPAWVIPVLSVIGFGVASYLAFVEVNNVTAVCGPVGDCNTVQESEYARLFGVLPIGILGMLGYVAIVAVWLVTKYSQGNIALQAKWLLFWILLFGVLFSIYLTFLEPFVIGATCAWCISSAVIMTLLLWAVVLPGEIKFPKATRREKSIQKKRTVRHATKRRR